MRPQQNRRMRGRGNNNNNNNNNNRKGPNPLTRSYESNGPDVKIRGTAQQIGEKYSTLARDAQSSGDRVMAENYLQHAEHYNRIIMTAQQQQQQAQQSRDMRDDDDRDDRDDDNNNNDYNNNNETRNEQSSQVNGSGPQPVIEGTPAEIALKQDRSGQDSAGQDGDVTRQGKGNGHSEVEAEGEASDKAPARPRRPRRSSPRRKPDEAGEEQPDTVPEAAQ